MASTGYTFPGAAANYDIAGATKQWTITTGPTLKDDLDATDGVDALASAIGNTGGDSVRTDYLYVSTFGFSIPAGSTIDGIQIRCITKSNGAGQAAQINCATNGHSIFIAGIPSGTIDTTDIWTSDDPTYTTFELGGATSLWGLTPTVSQINASDFGIGISAQNSAGTPTARIDSIEINIYYTTGLANLKTANTITKANIKTRNTIAIASIKSWNTIT